MTAVNIPQYADLPPALGYQSVLKDFGPDLTDMYAITMTYAMWKLGLLGTRTTSNVFCRSLLNNGDSVIDDLGERKSVKNPYLINSGAGLVAEWLDGWHWKNPQLRNLAQKTYKDARGNVVRIFPDEFLYWLSQEKISLTIDAIPEGRLIFPQQAALRLKGYAHQHMLIEAMMLQLMSSSTNQTTADFQVRMAARRIANVHDKQLVEASTAEIYEQAVLVEMALRRTPSLGGIITSRAAAIAGWNSTSNVYAARCYNLPTGLGTFAHSWVMLHDTEEEAFENWSKVFPNMGLFLADTIETVEGLKKILKVCAKHGHKLYGIKIDSGDEKHLSQVMRQMCNEAGQPDVIFMPTNNNDRNKVKSLYRAAGSEITAFGLGSEAAINRYQPLLDFVMKLSAEINDRDEMVRELIKLSNSAEKTTYPGEIDSIRFLYPDGYFAGDMIAPNEVSLGNGVLSRDVESVSLIPSLRNKVFKAGTAYEVLNQRLMTSGTWVQHNFINQDAGAIVAAARAACQQDTSRLRAEHLMTPPDRPYPYGIGAMQELIVKRNGLRDMLLQPAAA